MKFLFEQEARAWEGQGAGAVAALGSSPDCPETPGRADCLRQERIPVPVRIPAFEHAPEDPISIVRA